MRLKKFVSTLGIIVTLISVTIAMLYLIRKKNLDYIDFVDKTEDVEEALRYVDKACDPLFAEHTRLMVVFEDKKISINGLYLGEFSDSADTLCNTSAEKYFFFSYIKDEKTFLKKIAILKRNGISSFLFEWELKKILFVYHDDKGDGGIDDSRYIILIETSDFVLREKNMLFDIRDTEGRVYLISQKRPEY
jgi:hypothetical protein